MNTENYEKNIVVDATAYEAYQALTNGYSQWWTHCEGAFKQPGDKITFRFPPQASYWTFEAKELSPNQYVVLECIDAHHIILEKPHAPKTEWLGSFLHFKIETTGNQTLIHLVHKGLTPKQDCYDVCEAGWNHFFQNSLKKYLNTGTGEPHGNITT